MSCQAREGSPLRDSATMARMAQCAELGGARGIRANGPDDVAAIRDAVKLPIVGIYKEPRGEGRPFITPTFDHAAGVTWAGADLVALEATFECQPDTSVLGELVRRVREELRLPVMADVSNVGEGLRAHALGADLVATTLSGYTSDSPRQEDPDLGLVRELSSRGLRVVAEGRFRTPEQVRRAVELGVWAVVVGTAITNPIAITGWFARAVSGEEGIEGR